MGFSVGMGHVAHPSVGDSSEDAGHHEVGLVGQLSFPRAGVTGSFIFSRHPSFSGPEE